MKQALDHHAAAPCLLRVKARIRRAFPAEPLLWTARDDASSATAHDAAWEYRMVLQLADTADDKAYLGAVVAGESASTFFAGLPPTDLSRSNASLFALRQRVTALCAESAPPDGGVPLGVSAGGGCRAARSAQQPPGAERRARRSFSPRLHAVYGRADMKRRTGRAYLYI